MIHIYLYSKSINWKEFVNNNNMNKFFFNFKYICIILIIVIFFSIFYFGIIPDTKQIKIAFSKKSINPNDNYQVFKEKLKLILDNDEIFENEMMNIHTTFQLGGPAKFFIIPKTINKIIKVLQLCREFFIDYFILGNGSNLLVSDNGYDGLIININENNFSDLKIEQIDENNYKIKVGAGILMRTLAKKLCLLSLSV